MGMTCTIERSFRRCFPGHICILLLVKPRDFRVLFSDFWGSFNGAFAAFEISFSGT